MTLLLTFMNMDGESLSILPQGTGCGMWRWWTVEGICTIQAEDILRSSPSEKGGIYYFSERGDRFIDLASFKDKLWQKCNFLNPQVSSFGNEIELNEAREMIQHLLRWVWKYNRNLEEQAAQLHMLTGWTQIVEISISRRLSYLGRRSDVWFQVLDASLSASASPDCSLKMALLLSEYYQHVLDPDVPRRMLQLILGQDRIWTLKRLTMSEQIWHGLISRFCGKRLRLYWICFKWFEGAAMSTIKVPYLGLISHLTVVVSPFCVVFSIVWVIYHRHRYLAWNILLGLM